jgi:hypothetical protein
MAVTLFVVRSVQPMVQRSTRARGAAVGAGSARRYKKILGEDKFQYMAV